ncbi:MAG: hypothetical protein WB567_17520 [Terracidiphilus sp.]
MDQAPEIEKGAATKSAKPARPWSHLVFLVLAAVVMTLPCLTSGLPNSDDAPTHVSYQHFFNQEIAHGVWYPRWIFGLNGGLGSGIFFAQYPLPYYVAWAIGKLSPFHWEPYLETRSLGLGIVLATVIAVLSTYFWCASFSDRSSAAAAALVYITSPYLLTVDLYMRVAVGEYWSIALLPLCFLSLERMLAHRRFGLGGLALAYAVLILAHPFTAFLFTPILILYAMIRAGQMTWQIAAQTLAALALGGAISGVYSLPYLFQHAYLHPLQLVSVYGPIYSPLSQLFPFSASTYPQMGDWHDRVLIVRIVALAAIAFIAAAWYGSRDRLPRTAHFLLATLSVLLLLTGALAGHLPFAGEVAGALPFDSYPEHRDEIFLCTFVTFEAALVSFWSARATKGQRLANYLSVVAIASYIMTTSWSQTIWRNFHFLWNIQFPWRFNGLLAVATAGLCALGFAALRTKSATFAVLGYLTAFAPWCLVTTFPLGQSAGDMVRFEKDVDPALPIYVQADPRQAVFVKPPSDKKIHADVIQGDGTATVESIRSRTIELQASCQTGCTVRIGQFYYPLWHASISPSGNQLPLVPESTSGLMLLTLAPGQYHVTVAMPYTWPEKAGAWISLLSLFALAALAIRECIQWLAKRRNTAAVSAGT